MILGRIIIPGKIIAIQLHERSSTSPVIINIVQMLNSFFREIFEVWVIRLEIANNNIQDTDILSALCKGHGKTK